MVKELSGCGICFLLFLNAYWRDSFALEKVKLMDLYVLETYYYNIFNFKTSYYL